MCYHRGSLVARHGRGAFAVLDPLGVTCSRSAIYQDAAVEFNFQNQTADPFHEHPIRCLVVVEADTNWYPEYATRGQE